MHVSKGTPSINSTKIWLTRNGHCILENNKSKISKTELNELMEIISKHYFIIVKKWMEYYKMKSIDEVKFYC